MKLDDLILVSVDDHIVEPPTMFEQHLTTAQKAFAPKVLKDKNGADYWLFEGRRAGNIGLNAVVGRLREEYGCEPISFDQMRKGAWDIHARIDDMNANGLLASLNFPSVVTFDGSLFHQFNNKQNALALLQAYNDWHIDEWCGSYPGRNIPNAIVPYWDINATVAEIKRVVAKGCHAISFSDNPSLKGQPSIHDAHWEPLWKVCAENKVVINIHIGSGAQAPHASMNSPIDAWIITMPISIVNSAADWLHLKALHRYPDLKISLSEGGIGWIPYFLERADFVHEHHKAWTYADFGNKKPSDVFREHFQTCFIDDRFGLKNLDEIGEDNVSYECDYPHSDTVWPESADMLLESLGGLSDTAIDKITHGNALRLYNFDAFGKMGGRDKCTVGALRALAQNVDTEPKSYGGPAPLAEGEVRRRVTSGDIIKMFTAVGKADGQIMAEEEA
ncbi:amidohydrolase family protein [Pseudomonas aeruginosa]|uniref:amidohydrolase family protein n=1 Tax=Pseudomonas aeruginosa TaxID=287 RepID=UPI00071C0C13|nr:amidohydrolase family protein [Pseudomonas aeruginosa]KSE28015.1 amidohydrolase [Pseudomonas aeruginosa]KSG99913.1 amidohydrolase [Pseudomonas aeruginosa]KSS49654.1 amidohydrolase [Pseudomonas aeruginosa]MBA5113672.1 amidohydrolase [Pseudomonas aeruginosa]OWI78613.1 amidohydrolase [Pseudomonas aeruginosa]